MEPFTITGFINVPMQLSYSEDPDVNTLWLWNPDTDTEEVKQVLSPDSDLKVVKKGNAPYPYLKIRFEGMDTPETHFNGVQEGQPGTGGPCVRQNYGYLAQDQLFQLLGKDFEGTEKEPIVRLECRMIKGKRFYDNHKRVIGMVYVEDEDGSLNMQMVESGYAFPLLYASMDHQDKKEISELAQEAYNKDAGVWREYTVRPVEGGPPIPDNHRGEINDWGDVNFPKFWRRWTSYSYDPNGRQFKTFVDWLASLTDDKLAPGSRMERFSDAVSRHDYRLRVFPWELIFHDE